jgi:hypothetical protein
MHFWKVTKNGTNYTAAKYQKEFDNSRQQRLCFFGIEMGVKLIKLDNSRVVISRLNQLLSTPHDYHTL